MTPIDQVRPAQAGNWVRRPEEKRKRREPPQDRDRNPKKDPERGTPGEHPDHIVDELA